MCLNLKRSIGLEVYLYIISISTDLTHIKLITILKYYVVKKGPQ